MSDYWTAGVNALLEYLLLSKMSLLYNLVAIATTHQAASQSFWGALTTFESFVSEEWLQMDVSVWLLLLSVSCLSQICRSVMEYCAYWPSFLLSVIMLTGSQNLTMFAILQGIRLAVQSCYLSATEVLLGTWSGFASLLMSLSLYSMILFANAGEAPAGDRYVAKSNRGFQGVKRMLTRKHQRRALCVCAKTFVR